MTAELLGLEDGPQDAWQQALEEGTLKLQRCTACARHIWYPRVICPHCHADSLEWVRTTGEGTVHSVTVVARRPEHGGPYNVVLVDLDEGVRMMSRVDGIDADAIRIGMRVQQDIVHETGKAILVFRPAA
jgi:uncharacterized protein